MKKLEFGQIPRMLASSNFIYAAENVAFQRIFKCKKRLVLIRRIKKK